MRHTRLRTNPPAVLLSAPDVSADEPRFQPWGIAVVIIVVVVVVAVAAVFAVRYFRRTRSSVKGANPVAAGAGEYATLVDNTTDVPRGYT